MHQFERPWIEPIAIEIPGNFGEEVDHELGITSHPIFKKILVQRGFTSAKDVLQFINPDCYTPRAASEFPGIGVGVDRVKQAINAGEKICIWGDFDVDGQTSTALLVEALRNLGANVQYYIPQRATESHGVHIPSLSRIIDSGVSLVITCDTGISALEAVAYATSRQVDTIITDHHEPLEDLPLAYSLINPHFLPGNHPFSSLPGVGVAYKFVEELYNQIDKGMELTRFEDLVALGIIADVAELTGETRFLAQRGIEALRNTKRAGLQALFELSGVNPQSITEEHISYTIAPRLNALGRLSDANRAIEFLTAQTPERAYVLAVELEGLNAERQLMTDQIFRSAIVKIEEEPSLLEPDILILTSPTWTTGLVGIVASRLVDLYGKPVLLIVNPPNQIARGSARSIQGVNIIEAIKSQSHLLNSFGGHPMAAGISIVEPNIDRLRTGLSKAIEDQIGRRLPVQPIRIDATINLNDVSSQMVNDLGLLAPFGNGNPPIVVAVNNLHQIKIQTVGRSSEHLRVTVGDDYGNAAEVMWWHGNQFPFPNDKFDLAFTLHSSNFQGKKDYQLTWVAVRSQPSQEVQLSQKAPIEWIDKRSTTPSSEEINKIMTAYPDAQFWIEGGVLSEIKNGKNRAQLSATTTLLVGTIPPSRSILQDVLKKTNPNRVFLYNFSVNLDEPMALAKRLVGLLKYAMHRYEGVIDIEYLAALTSHRVKTVTLCTEWLCASQVIDVDFLADHKILIHKININGIDLSSNMASKSHFLLRAELAETIAFRAYYLKAPVQGLI